MPRRFVDLSVALEADIQSDPDMMLPQIEYFAHDQTAGQVASFFEGLEKDDLPGGEGWAIERLQIATHNGTHLDAPYHHHSTMNNGERAITIDEVPLEWCFGNGVKLDFRHFDDGYIVQPDDVAAELARIGHEIAPLDIVLVTTSAGARYGHPDYLGRGVRLTGTDAWSWDAPFSITAQRYARDRDPSIIWEGHRASMEIGYCHIEKLAQLDQLPGHGFLVSCFPFKIKAASAGFTRAVAIFEE